MMRTMLALALLATLIAGCASAQPSLAPSVVVPPSTDASIEPTGPTGSPTAEPATPPSSTPQAIVEGADVAAWTSAQILLLAGVADDVRPTCRAKDVSDIEEGIECFPDGVKIASFYVPVNFSYTEDEIYEKHLARHGVKSKGGGTCFDGTPGDIVDSVTDGVRARIGCYVDDNGLANAEFTLPPGSSGAPTGVYVTVVGLNDDIAKLFKQFDEVHGRSSPGDEGCEYCAAPWGLALPSEASGGDEPDPSP